LGGRRNFSGRKGREKKGERSLSNLFRDERQNKRGARVYRGKENEYRPKGTKKRREGVQQNTVCRTTLSTQGKKWVSFI